jgi:hypothetical protein
MVAEVKVGVILPVGAAKERLDNTLAKATKWQQSGLEGSL